MNEKPWGIKITYTWGDEESVNQYGRFKTKEDAFKKICKLVGTELYVANEEFDPDKTMSVYVDAAEYVADLTYECDGETCYYRVVDYDEAHRKEQEG